MFKYLEETSPEMDALLKKCGSQDFDISKAALREFTTALTLPLRQGVLKGDIIRNIFEPIRFQPGQATEFPLDFLAPGSEKDFVAYTIPNVGRIPEKHVEGDYIMVYTYDVGCSIDWALKYARDARWDIVGRAMQVLEASFIRKMNNDGWRTIIASAKSRNVVVYDDQAMSGLFTKRVVSLGEITMTRNAGGNSTSLNKGAMTDLFMSPENHADVLSWDLTQVPDALRQQIYQNWQNGGVMQIGRVRLHDVFELGVGQEYQTYFTSTLGGTLPTDKTELMIGLDLQSRDSFVMPIREEVTLQEDTQFARQRRAGMWGTAEWGFGALDSRRALALAS